MNPALVSNIGKQNPRLESNKPILEIRVPILVANEPSLEQ